MNVGVVGLGLIGGSIAKACLEAGWTVFGYDVKREAADITGAPGIIVDKPWDEWVQYVDYVVLATPLRDIEPWVDRILAHAPRGCTIIEVASVKHPLRSVYAKIRRPFTLLSLHPMAGKEVRGFAHSDSHLFKGRTCLVVDVLDLPPNPDVVQKWMGILGSIPVRVPLDQHDSLMSVVSHTPYLVSAAILVMARDMGSDLPLWTQVVGTGFLDVTRIGASDAGLWREILGANSENVKDTFAQFTHLIQQWNDQIQGGEWPEVLQSTSAIRQSLMLPDGVTCDTHPPDNINRE